MTATPFETDTFLGQSPVEYNTLAGQSSASWQVVQRFQYNADSIATAYNVDWSIYSGSTNNNWTILWHGQMQRTMAYGSSLYSTLTGGNWYDPTQARLLTPNGSNTYNNDPFAGDTGLQGFADRNAATNAGVAAAGIGLAVTIGTAGLLSEVGVPLTVAGVSLVAASAGGFAGGVATGYSNGYLAGHTGWQLAVDTGVGGVAGTLAGAAAAPLGEAVFIAARLPCGIGAGFAGGVAFGAVYGGIQGGYDGYLQNWHVCRST
jgi:hypothetical protein